ncbi:glucoamylase family protein [Kribbella catacumbae]|uniref:glucoamylase family protein n=1 Tax=Kribbella catacumbae TaxID=460086 RepID=UPI00037718E4|nr:glucoamylase family protein [Kribbella catacumbae]
MTANISRRMLLAATGTAALAGSAGLTTSSYAGTPDPAALLRGGWHPSRQDRALVGRWARDTWRSLVAMTDERTGLPADNIGESVTNPVRSRYTSPTNIGGYLWSTLVARELGIISPQESVRRLTQTLTTMARVDHHEPSGMYFNWYDEATGAVLTVDPDGTKPITPFVSSVDNGWFAAALMVVRNAEPRVRRLADSLLTKMNFAYYYNPDARPGLGAGLMRGGFFETSPPDEAIDKGNHAGTGPDVYYRKFHYDTCNTEARIAPYIGIARGQVPPQQYFATYRTFPESCDWAWVEQKPVGVHRTYLGIDVFEGSYSYRGMRLVPSWGGDMFESLMPDLFVPESSWAPRSWGINHPLTVRAHIEHGLDDAKYGYWGFSPASNPKGGYSVYGVDAIGMDPGGYPSDLEATNYDKGFDGCREGTNPNPTYGDGVVTPHAAFLAMQYAPKQAIDNLARIESRLHAYGGGGFFDSVAVRSGLIARRYLSLDQAMVMGAIGNVFADDLIRRNFAVGDVVRRVRPLIAMEQFSVGLD